MVYVVERYLPGLCRADLLPRISRLEVAVEELCAEGSAVRYLGSTIVLEDEACYCEFEALSEAAVAETNRRAGLPVDRIVPALLVHSNHRSGEMSAYTSIPKTPVRLGRSHPRLAIVAVAAAIAVAAAVIALCLVSSANRSTVTPVPAQASAPGALTPALERQYVQAVASMSYPQLAAAFNPQAGAPLASLTPKERRYVESVSALTQRQLGAAFGTGK